MTEQNKSKMLEEAQAKEVQVFKLLANISSEVSLYFALIECLKRLTACMHS